MNTTNEIPARQSAPEGWGPLLTLAAQEVFEIMLGAKLESAPSSTVTTECTAMVGLAGQLCGLLTLRCNSHAASLMASRMLGVETQQIDEQMWDAIGEIANMIAGNFKNKLTGMSDGCMLSVPTVITGSDYSCRSMADAGPLEVTLLFEGSPIAVAVEIHT